MTTLIQSLAQRDTLAILQKRFGNYFRILAVLTIALGTISTILSSTNVNVAIPSVMGSFGVGQDVAQWLSTGYLAASTVTMLCTAWLINSFGMRLTFISALIVFILSSLLGAVSPNIEMLILSRVIQGASSGVFVPLSMLLMIQLFPPEKQGFSMGIFGVMVIMAPALGPYLGGILIDNVHWRYVFIMPFPMAFIAFVMAFYFLPEKENNEKSSLDWIGLFLLSGAISLLLIGLSKGQSKGWTSDFTLLCFASMIITTALFLYRQTCITSPLFNLTLFKYPAFTANSIITIIFGAGLYSTFYSVPLFLQTIQGLNATSSGFSLLPGGFVLALMFPIGGVLSDKFPHWLLIGLGIIIFIISSMLMLVSDRQTDLWLFIYWVTIGRIGIGLIMPSLSNATFRSVPTHLTPQASGVSNFFRQFGGALGVNLTSIYLERQTEFHMDNINSTQHMGNPQTIEMVTQLLPSLQQAGINPGQQEYVAFWVLGKELYRQALTLAFQDAFYMTALIFIAALIPTGYLFLKRNTLTKA
ncbi:DHA2 family efflux MFS transporter permease subunit [Colwellia sp. 20A7]|uniref:DHA2 family efflux MFS transporter permease subunit n=1 Tax=Colwellia sp. 20A7 TaxID=2689569 RepID=UPI001357552D|nr:DHA2 family efflux MFS transporter permease subunit [Colwellia sp. 20A7]